MPSLFFVSSFDKLFFFYTLKKCLFLTFFFGDIVIFFVVVFALFCANHSISAMISQVSSSQNGTTQQGSVAAPYRRLFSIRAQDVPFSAAIFACDDQSIYVAHANGVKRAICDGDTVHLSNNIVDYQNAVQDVQTTDSGKLLMILESDGHARVFDLEKGVSKKYLKDSNAIAVLPASELILSAGKQQSGVWDMRSGRQEIPLACSGIFAHCAENGQRYLVGDADVVNVMDIRMNKLLCSLGGPKFDSVVLNSDGSELLSTYNAHVVTLNAVPSGKRKTSFLRNCICRGDVDVIHAFFERGDKRVLIAEYYGDITVLDSKSGKEVGFMRVEDPLKCTVYKEPIQKLHSDTEPTVFAEYSCVEYVKSLFKMVRSHKSGRFLTVGRSGIQAFDENAKHKREDERDLYESEEKKIVSNAKRVCGQPLPKNT